MLLTFILTLSAVLYVCIGKISQKAAHTSDDYYLMGKNLSTFPLMMTLLATQVGGGTLIGAADAAHHYGWGVVMYPLGACLGLMALGLGIGQKLRNTNVSTTAALFQKHSPAQHTTASLFSILTFFLILVAQAIAIRKMLQSIGYHHPLVFISFWTTLVAYTVMGGLKAVVNTDIVQALFILLILFLVFFFHVPSPPLSLASIPNPDTSLPWIEWLLLPFLFTFIEQDMGQRCFAAKSDKSIRYAALWASVLLFVCSLIAVYFGLISQSIIVSDASALVNAVAHTSSSILSSFFLAALLMAITSTADSLLCSISSNVYCDFLHHSKKTTSLTSAKTTTAIIGLASLAVSFLCSDIVQLLMYAYGLSVSALFVPSMAVLFHKNFCTHGSSMAMIVGTAGFFLGLSLFTLPAFCLGVFASAAAYFMCARRQKG